MRTGEYIYAVLNAVPLQTTFKEANVNEDKDGSRDLKLI